MHGQHNIKSFFMLVLTLFVSAYIRIHVVTASGT